MCCHGDGLAYGYSCFNGPCVNNRKNDTMRQRNHSWLILVLILLMAISGCGTSTQVSKPSNVRFMDMWGIYTHCSQSEDLDAMRVDAQRLSVAADVMDPAADPIPPNGEEPAPMEPSVRLSADPAAMAAACALRAGQVAQGMGRRSFAREMFQMIVTKFPQPRYRYYAAQAQEGLQSLDAVRSGWFPLQTNGSGKAKDGRRGWMARSPWSPWEPEVPSIRTT